MSIHRVKFVSLATGEFAAAWVDDERLTWEDHRLELEASIREWDPPTFYLIRGDAGAADVLFNPNAIVVASRVRSALEPFPELEFLPILVSGFGTYHVLHCLAGVDPPAGISLRRAPPPSGNIVELFGFPRAFSPQHAFFRVRQPPDSAAGRQRSCHRDLFVGPQGRDALSRSCGAYLRMEECIAPD